MIQKGLQSPSVLIKINMIQKGLQSPGIAFADTYENLNALIT